MRVKTQLVAAIVDASSAARVQKVKAAAAGRDFLDLGDDSDSSASSEESDKGRKPKVDNPLEGTLHNVQYRGAKFKAIVMRRWMYVEARAEVAQTIVSACLESTFEVVKEETMNEVAGPSLAKPLVTVLGGDGPNGSKVSDVSKEPDGSKVHEGSEAPDGSQEPERSGLPTPAASAYGSTRGGIATRSRTVR